jgi:protein involved in polysaccharide export with SLBB domain
MGKRLALLLSVLLVPSGVQSAAQEPTANSQYAAPQGQSVDCSDPLMAQTPQCQLEQGVYGSSRQGQQGTTGVPGMYPGLGATSPESGAGSSGPFGQQIPNSPNYRDSTLNGYNGLRRNYSYQQPLPPEPLTEFQRMVAASAGQVLPIFGANLFRSVPSTFAPVDQIPVTPNYVIGPGDELRIRLWGQINFNANVQVDRSGYVYLPQVGGVQVAGLQFADLDHQLRTAVGRIFRNFDLHVDLGQLRSIQIFLVGQARRPGAYTVSSLSTLVNALFATGGPAIDGSLRDIQVKRDGKLVTDFDLYDLLIDGDKSKDVQLLPGDVIYIPPAGPQVALWGSVRNAAIYELKSTSSTGMAAAGQAPPAPTTIQQLLSYAGGLTALASESRVSVDRVHDHQAMQSVEFALGPAGMSTPVRDGDLLHVLSVIPKYEQTVTLRGNTANPGRFAWHEGMRLSDLIPDQQSLLTRNYWWRRAQLGLPTPEFQPFLAPALGYQPTSPIDLVGTTGQLCNPFLTPYTSPLTPQQPDSPTAPQPYNTPYNRPCVYPYQLNSLYGTGQGSQQAGGASDQTQAAGGAPAQSGSIFDQTLLGQALGFKPNPQQQQSLPGQNANRANVSSLVAPDEQNGSQSTYGPNAKTDVRLPAPEIDWSYAVIERMDPKTLKTSLVPFNLGRLVMDHDASQDLALQPGDVVSVFSQGDIRVPLAQQTKFVRLEGEFVSAGVYSVKPGETLRQLVERAGGLTPDAYLFGSELDRESTRVVQQRRLDEYTQQLELEVQRGELAQATSAVASAQDLASASAGTSAAHELIARLRQLRSTGRIVLSMNPDSTGVDSLPDLPLEDGDRFVVPSRPSGVNVVGSVYDQNTFLFASKQRVGDYLRLAGGPNRDADRRHSFVIRADGSVISRQSDRALWGDPFDSMRINAGDTIVVPEKAYRPGALRGFIDWSQVFSQLALGAATINILR